MEPMVAFFCDEAEKIVVLDIIKMARNFWVPNGML